MRAYTLNEYKRMISPEPGCLLKNTLNYSKMHNYYYKYCDCVRRLHNRLEAYEDCKDCWGKGKDPIPLEELGLGRSR